jgi:hypothetical protein
MAVRVVLSEEAIGFEQGLGWFLRKCTYCGEKTYERISHCFPNNRNTKYWVAKPQHVLCHHRQCLHSVCKKWSKETDEIIASISPLDLRKATLFVDKKVEIGGYTYNDKRGKGE